MFRLPCIVCSPQHRVTADSLQWSSGRGLTAEVNMQPVAGEGSRGGQGWVDVRNRLCGSRGWTQLPLPGRTRARLPGPRTIHSSCGIFLFWLQTFPCFEGRRCCCCGAGEHSPGQRVMDGGTRLDTNIHTRSSYQHTTLCY